MNLKNASKAGKCRGARTSQGLEENFSVKSKGEVAGERAFCTTTAFINFTCNMHMPHM